MKSLPVEHTDAMPEHRGRVTEVTGSGGEQVARVRLDTMAGCDGCKLSSVCSPVNGVELTAQLTDGLSIATGDIVSLEVSPVERRLAVLVLLVTPLVVMLLTIGVMGSSGRFSEAAIGVTALAAVSLTFAVIAVAARRRKAPRLRWRITAVEKRAAKE